MNQAELKKFKRKQNSVAQKRLHASDYPHDLKIVAEGDSWFDYPLKKDILDFLIQRGYAIEKFAKAGDTLENMIYGTEYGKKKKVIQHKGAVSLQKSLKAIKTIKPLIFLFSGGGNDIVGSEMLSYLNHAHSKPDSLINKKIFKARLERIKIALSFMIEAVNKSCSKTQILMHGYDYAKVNGKGYSFIFKNIKGPWIEPSMAQKAIVKKKDQEDIITFFVDAYNAVLKSLDRKYSHFHHIDLRGKFPEEKEWDNEIHLKTNGFKEVSKIFHKHICEIMKFDPVQKHQDQILV